MQHGKYNQQYIFHHKNTYIYMIQNLQKVSFKAQQADPFNMHTPQRHNYGQHHNLYDRKQDYNYAKDDMSDSRNSCNAN